MERCSFGGGFQISDKVIVLGNWNVLTYSYKVLKKLDEIYNVKNVDSETSDRASFPDLPIAVFFTARQM